MAANDKEKQQPKVKSEPRPPLADAVLDAKVQQERTTTAHGQKSFFRVRRDSFYILLIVSLAICIATALICRDSSWRVVTSATLCATLIALEIVSLWHIRDLFEKSAPAAFLRHVYVAVVTIMSFAAIYSAMGVFGTKDSSILNRLDLSHLYFSVVTWTTLGYGDLQPTQYARVFAGVQALFGFIQMGIFVALLVAWLNSDRERSSHTSD